MRKSASSVKHQASSGVTLLEVLMAMLILGMVTGGIFTAFVFARQVSYRSTSQLVALGMMRGTSEQLRAGTVGLSPGIYVDQKLGSAPFIAPPDPPVNTEPAPRDKVVPLASLNFPDDPPGQGFRSRYQTNPGTARTWADHGDGRVMIVEGNFDLDGDGKKGVDVTGDNNADLYRVKVKVKWTPPSP